METTYGPRDSPLLKDFCTRANTVHNMKFPVKNIRHFDEKFRCLIAKYKETAGFRE